MRKHIAALAVGAAAIGSIFGFAGHADAQSVCISIHLRVNAPAAPVGLPVAVPVGLPDGIDQSACLPPDAPGLPGAPGLPEAPGLPSLPPLPV